MSASKRLAAYLRKNKISYKTHLEMISARI